MALNLNSRQAWITGACIFGAILWVGTRSNDDSANSHRRLDISFHKSKPHERNVVPLYDTTQLQFMSSPCRPENDGYFGSTSGTPLEIQFGFELETEDEENVEFLLEEIQEQVVDVVLSTTFPNLCGYRRRERGRHLMRGLSTLSSESQLKAKPRTTGFHFAMDLEQRTDVCAPVADPTNLCGVYKNTIGIYGRHLTEIGEHLLEQMKETLTGEQERLAKDGLVRLTTLDSLTVQTGDYKEKPSGIQALSFAAKAAIVVVIIALLAGMATFAVYVYLEHQKDRQERMYAHPRKNFQRNKNISSNSTVGEDASQISETVGLRDGTAVVLEGGRPVVIEFDGSSTKSRRSKDAIEEERSECPSQFFTSSVDGSKASGLQSYVPRTLQSDEECKEPESFLTLGDGNLGLTPVATARSMASLSEYTEHTEISEANHVNGEFT